MQKKRIMFFPVEQGIAHITRSLATAEKLANRNYHVIFALPQRKQYLVKNTSIKIVDILPILGKDTVGVFTKLQDEQFLIGLADEEIKLLKKYKPDCVVVDARPSAIASAAVLNIPTVLIGHSEECLGDIDIPVQKIPKLFQKLFLFLAKKVVKTHKNKFNKIIWKTATHYGYKEDSQHLFKDIHIIVPEIKTYISSITSQFVHYVGPIFWNNASIKTPSWFSTLRPNGKTVYVSFGGTGFDSNKLVSLCVYLAQKGYKVVVTASSIAHIDDFPKMKNLYVTDYLPGNKVVKKVDAVICHGGYGTLMQAFLAGKPTIAIPFNVDQLLHSASFEEKGFGKCLVKINFKYIFNILTLNHMTLNNMARFISNEEVYTALNDIIKNKKIMKAIQTEKKKYNTESVEMSATVIENILAENKKAV